jgi:hypothetical protein
MVYMSTAVRRAALKRPKDETDHRRGLQQTDQQRPPEPLRTQRAPHQRQDHEQTQRGQRCTQGGESERTRVGQSAFHHYPVVAKNHGIEGQDGHGAYHDERLLGVRLLAGKNRACDAAATELRCLGR